MQQDPTRPEPDKMPVWLGGAVRAQKECVQKKPEADCANDCIMRKG